MNSRMTKILNDKIAICRENKEKDLRLCGLGMIEIPAEIAEFKWLEKLILSGNELTDLSPIAGLTNLKVLGFSYNRVSDLSVITGLANLVNLSCAGNQLTDISFLVGLTKLECLNVCDNQIVNLGPLAELPELKKVVYFRNLVQDMNAASDRKDPSSVFKMFATI